MASGHIAFCQFSEDSCPSPKASPGRAACCLEEKCGTAPRGATSEGQPLSPLQSAGHSPGSGGWVAQSLQRACSPCPLTAPPPPHSVSPWGGALPCCHFLPLPSCLLTLILVLFALMIHTSAIPSSQGAGLHSLGPEFLNPPQSLLLKLKYSSLSSYPSPCLPWTGTEILRKRWFGW